MKLKKLTENEQKFVELYCAGTGKSKSYQIAYKKDEKNAFGYGRQASKLLARQEIKEAIICHSVSIEKNSKDIEENKKILKLIRDMCVDQISQGNFKKTMIDGAIMSIQELSKLSGLDIATQVNVYTKLADLDLKRETLEFNKSKIKQDNEDLQKENASLLRQLISKEEEN